MKIKVKGYLTFKDVIGAYILDLGEKEGTTLRELLIRISIEKKMGDSLYNAAEQGINRGVIVLLNGRNLTSLAHHLDYLLVDGDEIAIFPPLVGG